MPFGIIIIRKYKLIIIHIKISKILTNIYKIINDLTYYTDL